MDKLFREYKRIKKLARVMEGKLRPKVINEFLEVIDEEVIARLNVPNDDIRKMNKADPEGRLKILIPYIERYIQLTAARKAGEKIGAAEDIARTISSQAKHSKGKIELPYEGFRDLAKLNPAAYLFIEDSVQRFIYPFSKLRQILMNLEAARIVWDTGSNMLKIFSGGDRTRFFFTLYSQESYDAYNRPVFTMKIQNGAGGLSLTDLILKAAESILNI